MSDIVGLTAAEAHTLETHLRYAAEESYDAYGNSPTVIDALRTASYVRSARKHVLGTGRKPAKPQTRLDTTELAHERIFGALDSAERSALATHLDAAQREYRDAGGGTDMLLELVQESAQAEYAATAELQPNGLMVGRVLPR